MNIDPFLFTDAAVSDETRAFNAELRAILLAQPRTSTQTPQHIREVRRSGESWAGPVVHSRHARTIRIVGPGGDLDLRIIEPPREPSGIYFHIHGGGWVLGAADLSDLGNEAMAHAAEVAVVSVDYRLAPEHPFPAGFDDCVAAAGWLIENAGAEFGTDRLTIGGESAGANLAAATLLATRDQGYTDWKGANLVYGSYLPSGTPSVRRWDRDGYVLDSDTMQWFADLYVGDVDVRFDDPRLSPLHGDLEDLPPALFTIGTLDPLVDDTLFMAMRWEVAGNEADVAIYPGGVHAFDAFPTELGQSARERMHQFIASAVSS